MSAEPDLLPLPRVLVHVPHEGDTEMEAVGNYYEASKVREALATKDAEVEALRAEVETGHYNWNRFMEPITSYFVYKPGFVIRPESAREDEGGPYASHPCGAAKNIMCYVDALEARAERLAGALRDARDYVTTELSREREAFKGYEHASDIASIEADLARIDAALEQENDDA